MKNLSRGIFKIVQCHIFDQKKFTAMITLHSKNEILWQNFVKKLYCTVGSKSWSIQTFKKFHWRKHEKSERVFSSFACLWRHTISRWPRTHAYQWPSGVIGAFEEEKNRVNLVCPMSYFREHCDTFLEMKI